MRKASDGAGKGRGDESQGAEVKYKLPPKAPLGFKIYGVTARAPYELCFAFWAEKGFVALWGPTEGFGVGMKAEV